MALKDYSRRIFETCAIMPRRWNRNSTSRKFFRWKVFILSNKAISRRRSREALKRAVLLLRPAGNPMSSVKRSVFLAHKTNCCLEQDERIGWKPVNNIKFRVTVVVLAGVSHERECINRPCVGTSDEISRNKDHNYCIGCGACRGNGNDDSSRKSSFLWCVIAALVIIILSIIINWLL